MRYSSMLSARNITRRVVIGTATRSLAQPSRARLSSWPRGQRGLSLVPARFTGSFYLPRVALASRAARRYNVADTWCRRSYTAAACSAKIPVDDYILELQDLYKIAKDELEIATESTTDSTIYAVSDRVTLREAFDDLDRTYAAYTGTEPSPSPIERRQPSSHEEDWHETADEDGMRETLYDPATIPTEAKEEIKQRVGQQMRELRRAVEGLEQKAKEE